MARSIERVMIGQVRIGESICDVDNDELTTNAAINDSYDADEQDWHTVCDRRGHADVGQVLLQMYNGERYWTPSQSHEQWTWRLVGDDGIPVVNEDVVHEWRER